MGVAMPRKHYASALHGARGTHLFEWCAPADEVRGHLRTLSTRQQYFQVALGCWLLRQKLQLLQKMRNLQKAPKKLQKKRPQRRQ